MRLRLGLRPDPAGGAYSAPPGPLAGFKGAASRRGGGEAGREEKEKERRGAGREGKRRGGEVDSDAQFEQPGPPIG